MDPLSITSGVVGIVAFAFQLAKTASKVKNAVEEIKSAPKEARELIERLTMWETSCRLIGFHLERRENLLNSSSPTSLDIISRALAQYLAKAQDLEQMLSILSASNGLNQTSQSKFGAGSRLRLILRKDKIISLVQEIDRVISLLQFVIQVDMWTSLSIPPQPPPTSSDGIEVMDKSTKLETSSSTLFKDSAPSQYALDQKFRRAKNQQCRTFRYLDYITWTTTDGWIGDDDDDDANRIAYRKGRITFRLPFTTTQYSMHYGGGMGTPSYALNVAHIIDQHSQLGSRLYRFMCPSADPKELHELISSRKLSIYSVYRCGYHDFNLFFMAVAMRWAEGCRYLLQHDFRHEFVEDEPPKFMFCHLNPPFGKACEVTEILLSIRPHDLREKDINFLLDTGCEPEYYGRYLSTFLKSPAIDHHDLLSRAWTAFVHRGWHDMDSSWIQGLRTFIDHGVDLHQFRNSRNRSPYITILSSQNHPFDADDKAYSWLEMLRTCGIDISSYLDTENALIDKFGFNPYTNRRKMKKVVLDFDGLPMPSWRWELPAQSSISEVMEEFLNLGLDNLERAPYSLSPEGPDDIKSWKSENFYGHQIQFPFLQSPLDLTNMKAHRLNGLWCWESYNRAIDIRDKRIARHQAKKLRKAHPGKTRLSNRMPGAWVE